MGECPLLRSRIFLLCGWHGDDDLWVLLLLLSSLLSEEEEDGLRLRRGHDGW